MRDILSGQERGPRRDLVLLNVAGGLVVSGLAVDLRTGWEMAGEIVDEGRALRVLENWRAFAVA